MERGRRSALAGVLAAVAAVVATEVIGLAAATDPSLLLAVQSWFIDSFGASLKDLAVALFGTANRVALEIGAYLVIVGLGVAAGRWEASRRWAGAALITAFGLLGTLAGLAEPQHHTVVTVASGVVGTAVGVGTLWLLLDRFGIRVMPGRPIPDLSPDFTADQRAAFGEPGRASLPAVAASRREVGLWALGTGATIAIGASLTKGVGEAVRQGRSAIPVGLPRPRVTAALPSPTFQVDGLTPYVVPNADFYRIDTTPAGQAPFVDLDRWSVQITGLVDREISFTYAELLARDLVEEVVTLSCVSNEVGGDLVGNAVWTGIPLRDLLAEAGMQPSATQLVGEAVDGFTAGFPTAALDDADRTALLAIGMNGRPLPRANGFPARLVVSGLYGYVSATKWLSEIRLTTMEAEDCYWITRGWAKEAPVKTQSRIDVPRRRQSVTEGTVPVAGVAWAPHRGIERVEVKVDDEPWVEAELGAVTSDHTWVQWLYRWDATPGDHTIRVRATDGDGVTQGSRQVAPAPDGAEGWDTREVAVAAR